jgi:hypothetical protein
MSTIDGDLTKPAAGLVPAWVLQLDPWEAATAVFIVTVMLGGDFFGGRVLLVAGNIITMSVICEFAMVWTAAALGQSIAQRSLWLVLPRIVLALAVYLGCVTMFVWDARAFYLIPQAVWILAGRFRPRAGVPPFSDDNLRRFTRSGVLALVLVVVHVMLIGLAAIVTDRLGMATKLDGMTIPPPWVYAVIWGAYYFELAYFVPLIEVTKKQTPG